MSSQCEVLDGAGADSRPRPVQHEDAGGILVFVLVAIAIISLIAIPMLGYASAVFGSGKVQAEREQALQLANGGTWVAMSNERQLYKLCNGGSTILPSSLPDVQTTCEVLDTETLRPATELPYELAVAQAGKAVPPQIAKTAEPAANPPEPGTYGNTASPAANYKFWASETTPEPNKSKIWLPKLPVQSTSAGGNRDIQMASGWDPNFSSCRVFFPGTFTSAIEIKGPAYFTSGVYYFTEPITLKKGANVVVGNGSEIGCTTEYEAIANIPYNQVPEPLNLSGLGGTFVFGENARIAVDESGPESGDIRFAINQRYVSDDETSVAASSDVAIVSVNGDHGPGTTVGQNFDVNGVLHVPPSAIGIDNPPSLADSGYRPSTLTPKPTAPDAPQVVNAKAMQIGGSGNRGWVRVDWNPSNPNGSLITQYEATDSVTGRSCRPKAPTAPDTSVQTSCTITGIPDGTSARVTVRATNDRGTSAPSAEFSPRPTVQYGGSSPSPSVFFPNNPRSPTVSNTYSNGMEISWLTPTADGGSAITEFLVIATPVSSANPTVECRAWWDELACVLPTGPGGMVANAQYNIRVWSIVRDGTNGTEYRNTNTSSPTGGAPISGAKLFAPGTTSAPVQTAATAAPRIPTPIVDFTTTQNTTKLDVFIGGYVSVPQGRLKISAKQASQVSVGMVGGVLAGEIVLEPQIPTGTPPSQPAGTSGFRVFFDNPVAQKRVRIVSTVSGKRSAQSAAVIQVNRSGSLGINSWVVQ